MDGSSCDREFLLTAESIRIKSLHTLEEMKLIVGLQDAIWTYGRPGAAFPYPDRCLFEFAESGGLIGAAFKHTAPIGFSAAWLGRDRSTNRDYLHSQLVGVVDAYRNSGVGYQLKLHQRDYARAMKLELIKWTFDPLKTRNANLNLRKLGGVIRNYTSNYYGNLQSIFNKGLATDRFWVEWYVDSSRVESRIATEQQQAKARTDSTITQTKLGASGFKELCGFDLDASDAELFVEVPDNLETILENDVGLAKSWQQGLRRIFSRYFERGYILTDLFRFGSDDPRIFYKLENASLTSILDKTDP